MKNLIISFAPGARGFLLGKWLINNQLGRAFDSNTRLLPLNHDSTNHDFTPIYNDLLLDNRYSMENFQLVNQALSDDSNDIAQLSQLFFTSKFVRQDDTSGYDIILTHYSSFSALTKLKHVLNATIIRITFKDIEQANSSYLRKFNYSKITDADINDLESNYYTFIHKFEHGIDIPLDTVTNLDLEFLKEQL
jgi:hypothetical protein